LGGEYGFDHGSNVCAVHGVCSLKKKQFFFFVRRPWVAQREPLSSALFFSAALADEYGEAHSAASTEAARRHLIEEGEWSAILGLRTEKGRRRSSLTSETEYSCLRLQKI
jgi:hypothetical protein